MSEKAKSVEMLDAAGLRPLHPSEERTFTRRYQEEMLRGLSGRESSLHMYKTLLSPVDTSTIPDSSSAAVVEIGGTNLRTARIVMTDGTPQVVESTKDPIRTKFRSATEFYREVAGRMEMVMQGGGVDAVGVVFSFPGDPVKREGHVDVISQEALTKNFEIPGISKKAVGEALAEQIDLLYGVGRNCVTAVMNDTPAVLLAGDKAKIGGVVGTGFNLAFDTPQGIVNSESGGFNNPFTHSFAKEVDVNSQHPGRDLTEKQISGLYLGKQFALIAAQFGIHIEGETGAEDMSRILRRDFRFADEGVLVEAAERLTERSSQLVGLMTGTVFNTFPRQFPESHIVVPVEGSVFWGMPGYAERTKQVAERISGKKVDFLNTAGMIGAGVAALSAVSA